MSETPKRRWFQFGIGTLFVLVTALAAILGWASYQLNWIRQRREMVSRPDVEAWCHAWADGHFPPAPGELWLFGAHGYDWIKIVVDVPLDPSDDVPLDRERTADEVATLERARELFPEAAVQEVSLNYMRNTIPMN
jgi:hypothetical protein